MVWGLNVQAEYVLKDVPLNLDYVELELKPVCLLKGINGYKYIIN